MIIHRPLLTVALGLCLGLGALGSTAAAQLSARAEFLSRDIEVRAHEEARHQAVEIRADDQLLWSGELPRSALAFSGETTMDVEILSPRGRQDLLRLTFRAQLPGEVPLRYELVFSATDRRARRLELLWQGRIVDHEPGDRLHLMDVDDDGRDELLLVASNPGLRTCGPHFVPLHPRLLSTTGRETPARVSVPIPADARSLTPAADEPSEFSPFDTRLVSVSSRADVPLTRSYGPPPDALLDADPGTLWRSAGPPAGQFLNATITPHAELAGLTIARAGDDALRWLLLTEDGSAFVLEPGSASRNTWLLPQPIATRCATLVQLAPIDSPAIEIGEVRFHTRLDLLPTDDAARTLLTLWREEENALQRQHLIPLLASEIPRLTELLGEEARQSQGARQAELVSALIRSEDGRRTISELLRTNQLQTAAIATLGRSSGHTDAHGSYLKELLEQTSDPTLQVQLLRILTRSVSPDQAHELIPWVARAPAAAASDLAFGLGRTPPAQLHELLAALGTSPEGDQILLRALLRIARTGHRLPPLQPEGVAQLRTAVSHDNGTVARLACLVAGWLPIEDLTEDLTRLATEDPHPMMRQAALQGIEARATRNPNTRPAATTLFLQALDDADPGVRMTAARGLSSLPLNEEGRRIVQDALRADRWPEVTRPLLLTLIRQRNDEADRAVLDWLQQAERDQLRAALVAWQSRGSAVPVHELAALRPRLGDSAPLQRALVRTLGRGGAEATPLLRAWVQEDGLPTEVHGELLETLGRSRDDASALLLIASLQHEEPAIRRAAARGLAFHPSDAARHALELAAEREEHPSVQRALQGALQAIRQARGLQRVSPGEDATSPEEEPSLRR